MTLPATSWTGCWTLFAIGFDLWPKEKWPRNTGAAPFQGQLKSNPCLKGLKATRWMICNGHILWHSWFSAFNFMVLRPHGMQELYGKDRYQSEVLSTASRWAPVALFYRHICGSLGSKSLYSTESSRFCVRAGGMSEASWSSQAHEFHGFFLRDKAPQALASEDLTSPLDLNFKWEFMEHQIPRFPSRSKPQLHVQDWPKTLAWALRLAPKKMFDPHHGHRFFTRATLMALSLLLTLCAQHCQACLVQGPIIKQTHGRSHLISAEDQRFMAALECNQSGLVFEDWSFLKKMWVFQKVPGEVQLVQWLRRSAVNHGESVRTHNLFSELFCELLQVTASYVLRNSQGSKAQQNAPSRLTPPRNFQEPNPNPSIGGHKLRGNRVSFMFADPSNLLKAAFQMGSPYCNLREPRLIASNDASQLTDFWSFDAWSTSQNPKYPIVYASILYQSCLNLVARYWKIAVGF